MRIYLVQHGKPVSKEQDPERPLSDQGRSEVGRVAEMLKAAGIRPARIFHSGKLRAQQTAEILASILNPGTELTRKGGLSPLDDPSIIGTEIKDLDDGTMIVGHLPHLGKLASLLVRGDAEKAVVQFQQGGVVCLAQGDEGDWTITWMVVPEILPQ